MARIFFKKGDRKPSVFATLGLITICLASVTLLVAGPGFRFGLAGQELLAMTDIELQTRLLHVAARLILIAAAFTVACIIHGRTSPRARVGLRGFGASLLVLVLGYLVLPIEWQRLHTPPLHDISTNLDNPPQFQVLPERSYDPLRPATLAGSPADKNYRTLHTSYYADLAPIVAKGTIRSVTSACAQAARRLGWSIATVDPETGHIEAETESFWFGFQNRIAIDVRAKDAAALLDIRSLSVLGTSDMGIGAGLIRDFREALAEALAKPE